jgi:hypothetical protein
MTNSLHFRFETMLRGCASHCGPILAIFTLKYVAFLPRLLGFERATMVRCRYPPFAADCENRDSSHVNNAAGLLSKITMPDSGGFWLIFAKPVLATWPEQGVDQATPRQREYCGEGVALAW